MKGSFLKYISTFVFVSFFCCSSTWAENSSAILEISGSPATSLLTGSNASPREIETAQELLFYLHKMSGVKLECRTWSDSLKSQGGMIIIGQATLQAGGFTVAELNEAEHNGGYRIRARNGILYLAGADDEGTYNAIFGLLRLLGASFYGKGIETVPVSPLKITDCDLLEKPFFELRLLDSFAYQNGAHSFRRMIGDPYSGVDPLISFHAGWEHSAAYLVPFYLYAKEHPEYFAENEFGARVAVESLKNPNALISNIHLCLSNPDVRKIAIERLLTWINLQKERKFFAITQPDGEAWCQCAKCKALDGGPGSGYSDRLLDFVNELAAVVAQKYPEKIILTLAYGSSEPPPRRVKPLPNVRVMYCTHGPGTNCWGHGLKCDKNKMGYEHYRAWLKCCPNQVYIYEYPLHDFQALEFTHEACIEKMKMYAEDGVRGVYFCGQPFFLRPLFDYVQQKMLWDPKADTKALTSEFMNAYFGKAAPQMIQIYDLLAHRSALPEIHQGGSGDLGTRKLASVELVNSALNLFQEAESMPENNPDIIARLKREKSFVLYSDIIQRNPVNNKMPDGINVFGKRLQEYLTLSRDGLTKFDAQSTDSIRNWFWRVARVKIEELPWKKDPTVIKLVENPMAVLKQGIALERNLEPIAGNNAWRIPLILFEGGREHMNYNYQCSARTGIAIYGKLTRENVTSARFKMKTVPATKCFLVLEGQDDDKPYVTKIRISINGKELFQGANGFMKKGWSQREFQVPTGLLQEGENELSIENLEEINSTTSYWFMLAGAQIEFKDEK